MKVFNRKNLQIGMLVEIISNEEKGKDIVSRGYITKIISQQNSKKGVKVRIHTGQEGRVVHVVTKEELRLENFKFYNQFFFLPYLYTVWDETAKNFLVFDYIPKNKTVPERTALLFESEEMAREFLKGTVYDSPSYKIRRIHRKKPIVEMFKKVSPDYFRINGERKLSAERLNEWEYKFKQMR